REAIFRSGNATVAETHLIRSTGSQSNSFTEEHWSSEITSFVTAAPPKFIQPAVVTWKKNGSPGTVWRTDGPRLHLTKKRVVPRAGQVQKALLLMGDQSVSDLVDRHSYVGRRGGL
ncbi:hypothetical protein OSTOST_13485, partial [Ostertagia ostertagi]